tara:strand:- start:254 stop:451 length:198 start_codon:yes stop_codon:yes gene_type:complete
MGKVKSWAWDCAEEQSDDIIKSYVDGKISKEKAIIDLSNVENLDLVGIDEYNVDEVLDMAKSEAA